MARPLTGKVHDLTPTERFNRRRRTLTSRELDAMTDAAETDKERAMFQFLRATGCRVHEMLAVRRQDVDLDAPAVTFLVTKGKVRRKKTGESVTEEEPRETPLNIFDDRAISALRTYLRSGGIKLDRRIFPVTDRTVRDVIKRLAERGNVRAWGEVHPHTLRHTAATEALRMGFEAVEIKHMMGWSKFSTTFETTYAHPTTEGLIEKARRFRKMRRAMDSEE